MAFNLANALWTIFSDERPLPVDQPKPVFLNGGTVNTSLGSDKIIGEGDASDQAQGALLTGSRLFMSIGNDSFMGTGADGADGGSPGSPGASGITARRLSAKLSARGAALSTAAILLRDVGHAFKVLDRVVINIGPAAKD